MSPLEDVSESAPSDESPAEPSFWIDPAAKPRSPKLWSTPKLASAPERFTVLALSVAVEKMIFAVPVALVSDTAVTAEPLVAWIRPLFEIAPASIASVFASSLPVPALVSCRVSGLPAAP